jgi:hypothetical protein
MKARSAGIVFSILAVRLPVLALFTPGRGGHAETRLEQAAEKRRGGKFAVQRDAGHGARPIGDQQPGCLFQAESTDVLGRRLTDQRGEYPVEMEGGEVCL